MDAAAVMAAADMDSDEEASVAETSASVEATVTGFWDAEKEEWTLLAEEETEDAMEKDEERSELVETGGEVERARSSSCGVDVPLGILSLSVSGISSRPSSSSALVSKSTSI